MIPSVEAVEDRLRAILAGVLADSVDAREIRSDVALMNQGLSLDSVALLELIVRIEGEFNILLDDGLLTTEHFASLNALATSVRHQIARQTNGHAR